MTDALLHFLPSPWHVILSALRLWPLLPGQQVHEKLCEVIFLESEKLNV